MALSLGTPNLLAEQIVEAYHKGWYQEDKETIWIEKDNEKIGLIMLHDITDTIPSFDIRLDKSVRGKGIGTLAVNWTVDYLFGLPDRKIRIEAYTRSDNLAMKKHVTNADLLKKDIYGMLGKITMGVYRTRFAMHSLEGIGRRKK